MKKLLLAASAAAMAAFGLMACGDEVTNINNQVGIQQVAAGDTLGKCSDKNAGEMVFVTDSAAVYYCAGDEWLPLNGKDGVDGKDGADGKDGVPGKDGENGISSVDTLVVRDTVFLDNRDTIVSYDTLVTKDTVYVYDTTYVKFEPEYDTVTTAYLNQEMLAAGKYGVFVDKRDNKVYRTIEIGQQIWMAQNLDYYTIGLQNYCYDNDVENCRKYGRLYSWASALNLAYEYNTTKATTSTGADSVLRIPAQGICPEGWHVPSQAEVKKLEAYVEAVNTVALIEEGAGTSLKSSSLEIGWWDDAYGTDRFGFSFLPSGEILYTRSYNKYQGLGADGEMWTSTENAASEAIRIGMFYSLEDIGYYQHSKIVGRPVRCLKDAE